MALHSGMYGGAAPDALAALDRDARDPARRERQHDDQRAWTRRETGAAPKYPPEQFRQDAGVPDGVDLLGEERLRHALGQAGRHRPRHRLPARRRLPPLRFSRRPARESTCVCRPAWTPKEAQTALIEYLKAVAPWNVQLEFEREAEGGPFKRPGRGARVRSFDRSDGRGLRARCDTAPGQGGSIPLCTVLQETFPDAEIMLLGVEEPLCLIHAPNESVDPTEIEHMALVEALFFHRYAQAKSS